MSMETDALEVPSTANPPIQNRATQLAKPANGNGIAKPAASRFQYEGEDEGDTLLPRVHLFQGLPKEREIYGKGPASGGEWKAGDLINSLTGELIESRRFVPLFGWNEYIKFQILNGSTTGIEYRTREKRKVPPNDLEWNQETKAKPAATKFMNFAVLFENVDVPLVISFKVTSLPSGKTLVSLEKLRGKRGPGLYQFDVRGKSNTRGSWLTPVIRPIGDPSPEMTRMAIEIFGNLSPATVDVAQDAGAAVDEYEAAGSGPDTGDTSFDPDKL